MNKNKGTHLRTHILNFKIIFLKPHLISDPGPDTNELIKFL